MSNTVPSAETHPAFEENFDELFAASIAATEKREGSVVVGKVIALENDTAVIDVGLKAEGRVPFKEFIAHGHGSEPAVGDEVEVFLDRIENRNGEAVLSRDRARREQAWSELEEAFEAKTQVTGIIWGRVKGGYTVDLQGASAFLPRSQVDLRPVRDAQHLFGTKQPFYILKMDRRRGNIVISRRAVLEETRAEARAELVATLKEGQILDGVVKNITEYGAFVDLGEVDGLLHVADMSWRRVHHPSEVVSVGQKLRVQVVRFNPATQRISLGIKQLEADPWEGVVEKYPKGAKFRGRVTNITEYGAFVELEPGIEGLVHVSEMSWTRKNVPPSKLVSTSEEVEVMILGVDPNRRRVSLGMRQCAGNPWEKFAEDHPIGSVIEGEVRNITEFGVFLGMPGDIDGLIHLSDLDATRPGEEAIKEFRKGDRVRAKVLEIDVTKERINLSTRQIEEEKVAGALAPYSRGQVVTCVVTEVTDSGLRVTVDDVNGFIRRSDLSKLRTDQNPHRFAVGERVDAKVVSIDTKAARLVLSIKSLEIEEEQRALREYGSSESGASLGDILSEALKPKEE
jgi:small subunit ribosomal protein S1